MRLASYLRTLLALVAFALADTPPAAAQYAPQLVVDAAPGPNSSLPYSFTEVDGRLYFLVRRGNATRDLWVVDQTGQASLAAPLDGLGF